MTIGKWKHCECFDAYVNFRCMREHHHDQAKFVNKNIKLKICHKRPTQPVINK